MAHRAPESQRVTCWGHLDDGGGGDDGVEERVRVQGAGVADELGGEDEGERGGG